MSYKEELENLRVELVDFIDQKIKEFGLKTLIVDKNDLVNTLEKVIMDADIRACISDNLTKWQLLDLTDKNEIFKKCMLQKLQQKPEFSEDEKEEFLDIVKKLFIFEDIYSKEDIKEYLDNQSISIDDVFDKVACDDFIQESVKNSDLTDYFEDDDIKEHCKENYEVADIYGDEKVEEMLKDELENNPELLEEYIEELDSDRRIGLAIKILNSLKG